MPPEKDVANASCSSAETDGRDSERWLAGRAIAYDDLPPVVRRYRPSATLGPWADAEQTRRDPAQALDANEVRATEINVHRGLDVETELIALLPTFPSCADAFPGGPR